VFSGAEYVARMHELGLRTFRVNPLRKTPKWLWLAHGVGLVMLDGSWGRPMTEAEWLACDDTEPMLVFLNHRMTDRKSRLFACACCRQIWNYVSNSALRNAVEVSERFADQEATQSQLSAAARKARRVASDLREAAMANTPPSNWATGSYPAAEAAALVALKGIGLVRTAARLARAALLINEVETIDHADLLRDIFGNPFRPVSFNPEWRSDTVLALAHQVYEARDFSAMPILADALQDAGCDDEAILSHCRDANQPHARGCWVVDLVLGKE